MTVRMTLGLAVFALGVGIAALAGIPALIENRAVGDTVVVVGLGVGVAGLALMLTSIRAELNAHEVRKVAARRKVADERADAENLRVKRRRILHTKIDILVRLKEAEDEVEFFRSKGDIPQMQDARRMVRNIQLENVNVEANLEFNANEFRRRGLDAIAFDASE